MAETAKKLTDTLKESDVQKGVFLEADCFMCGEEKEFANTTVKGLAEQMDEEGWKELHSDEYNCVGYWCGCEYESND